MSRIANDTSFCFFWDWKYNGIYIYILRSDVNANLRGHLKVI